MGFSQPNIDPMYQERLVGFRDDTNYSFFEFKQWNHTVVAQSDSVKIVYLDFFGYDNKHNNMANSSSNQND